MLCKLISGLFVALFKSRQELIVENLALRQQLAVQQHRPYFLGLVIKNLERLEIITDYCKAPYCYWLA